MVATKGRQSTEWTVGREETGLAPGEEEPGPRGWEGGYLSRGLCGSQGIAREILPEQQGLLSLLPSQAVTVVLKIIRPPRDREPRRQGGRRGGAAGRGSGLGGGAARGLRDSQLVEHALHLLVDAEGRALLLIPVGVAGPVTLRQGAVLLDGSLALPLPPPHGRDLNGRQVQRLQRRGRVHEEKGVGAGRGGKHGPAGRAGRQREDTVTRRNRNTSVTETGRQTQMGTGLQTRRKTDKKQRKQSSKIRGKWLASTTVRCA